MMVMIATALAAAVLYGAGAAMEQRQAAAAPQSSAGRPRLLFQLARQPLWLFGITVQIGGFAAHAVALRSGSLATVQMVVSGEFVVAVVIVRIWSGRPLGRASWAAALTVVASIAVFLALTAPSHGHAAGQPEHAAAMVLAATATGGAALAAAAVGLRAAGRRRAVLLAVAAGLADACSAVVTMGFSHAAGHGLAAIFTSWAVYAVVACGAANVLLTQSAYQTGRPILTLPIIAAVTPVASVAVGIGLLGETPRIGLPGAVAAGLAVLVTSLALARLAYCAPHPQVAHPEPKRMGPTGRERIGLPSMAALGSLDACGSRDRDGGPGPQRPGRRGGRLISRVRAMKFSLWPDNDRPPAELLDEVRAAEAAGWHGVWLADHYMPNTGDATPARGDAYECWGLLPAMAAVTERVRIGTLVSPTSVHHPALLAKRAATIDRLSGGRMVLGLGAGWQINEHHAYGIELERPGRRVSRFEEAITIVRSMLGQDSTTFDGEFYHFADAPCDPKPVQSPLPILVGTRSPRMLGITARQADEWNTWGTPEQAAVHRAALLAACDKAGRDPATMRTSVNAFIDLGAAAPPAGRATLSGSAAAVVDQLGQYAELGFDEFILPDWNFSPDSLADTLARIKTEVLDQLPA